jgi:hypothetical protein
MDGKSMEWLAIDSRRLQSSVDGRLTKLGVYRILMFLASFLVRVDLSFRATFWVLGTTKPIRSHFDAFVRRPGQWSTPRTTQHNIITILPKNVE